MMRNRLNDSTQRSAEALRGGRPMSISDQRLLSGLSGAESRILGSAQLGKLRDIGVGLLRVTTLLGAVLLVPVKEPVQNPSNQQSSGETSKVQPANITLQPIYDRAHGMDRDGEPITLNVDVNVNDRAQQTGSNDVTVQVIDRQPLYLASDAKVVIGAGAGYWYRSVLGVGDYFWALPDGDFNFTVDRWEGCDSGFICAVLKFSFDTRNSDQSIRWGDVLFPAQPARTGRAVARTGKANLCGEQIPYESHSITRCRYPSGEGRELVVDVKASATPATAREEGDGKSAFDVRWCWTHSDPQRSNCPIALP